MVQRIAQWGKCQKYCECDRSVTLLICCFPSTLSHIPIKNEEKAGILGLNVILKQAFILRNFAVPTFVTIFNTHKLVFKSSRSAEDRNQTVGPMWKV